VRTVKEYSNYTDTFPSSGQRYAGLFGCAMLARIRRRLGRLPSHAHGARTKLAECKDWPARTEFHHAIELFRAGLDPD
jgi:hypothetical protein